MVRLDGSAPVELVSPGQDPTWSPDDSLIGYRSGGAGDDGEQIPAGLSVIGADGTGQRLVDGSPTDNPYAFTSPRWSPDGQRIAYHAGRDGDPDIFVAAVQGSAIDAVADGPTGEVWPVWSPDGTRMAWVGPSSTPGMYQVVVADPDGSNPTTLEHPPLGCNCSIHWSPDGTLVTAYMDGPVGHEDTGGSTLLIDVSGAVPPAAVPFQGLSYQQQVSWQRLAP